MLDYYSTPLKSVAWPLVVLFIHPFKAHRTRWSLRTDCTQYILTLQH